MKSGTDLISIADDVRAGWRSAEAVIEATLARIEAEDGALNCFTAVFADAARRQARDIDARVLAGQPVGPLAGAPFGVKGLFDVEGMVTLAGSIVRRSSPTAVRDAVLVQRLKASDAILVGALNMDEFAYGFSTENAHYGPTHNPHDRARMCGGSSGGSAAAVAAGLLPLALGSDTNGSIRVPAAFCGVFGMKPTFGRLSRAGAFPLSASLDHTGHFARTARELALAYDLLQGAGPDLRDLAFAGAAPELASPDLDKPMGQLKVGVLGGWFQDGASDDVLEGLDLVASVFKGARSVRLPEVERARAAAFCITAAEAGALHLDDLGERPAEFDPATRDRLMAGALMPSTVLIAAQRFRQWFRIEVAKVFDDVDVLIAPTTACSAPRLDQAMTTFLGEATPVRSILGLYTQPISFIGLPVVAAPVRREGLPVGVQIITRPWAEALGLRVAHSLEMAGALASAKPPPTLAMEAAPCA